MPPLPFQGGFDPTNPEPQRFWDPEGPEAFPTGSGSPSGPVGPGPGGGAYSFGYLPFPGIRSQTPFPRRRRFGFGPQAELGRLQLQGQPAPPQASLSWPGLGPSGWSGQGGPLRAPSGALPPPQYPGAPSYLPQSGEPAWIGLLRGYLSGGLFEPQNEQYLALLRNQLIGQQAGFEHQALLGSELMGGDDPYLAAQARLGAQLQGQARTADVLNQARLGQYESAQDRAQQILLAMLQGEMQRYANQALPQQKGGAGIQIGPVGFSYGGGQ